MRTTANKLLVGLLPGEGIGPELVNYCQKIAEALELQLTWMVGGEIGLPAQARYGAPLSQEVCNFCQEVFDLGGPILSGPGGGRYVYDLRRHFQLYYKLNPVRTFPQLSGTLAIRTENPVDILIVRETCSGIYHAQETEEDGDVTTSYVYTRAEVDRLMREAARLAANRRKELTVVCKLHGQPLLSQLWVEAARRACNETGVRCRELDPDYGSYLLLRNPEQFDVVACSNDIGDILSDLGGLLMGSRGMTWGACYSARGHGIYQTNHGSGHDLRGRDQANPAGQLLSFAMLLRESLGLDQAADRLEAALGRVWTRFRTPDIQASGYVTVGTSRFVAELVEELKR